MTENSLSTAALAYARKGLHVFPCRPGGKAPATRHGLGDATTDPKLIADWWDANPDANIGIACGPSRLVVVDVDRSEGLRRLLELRRLLPATLSAVTGSGGVHFYYRAPAWVLRNTAGRLPGVPGKLPGVDLRADGGYVVTPPSVTTGVYEWVGQPTDHTPRWRWTKTPAPCPSWLREPPPPPPLSRLRTRRPGTGPTRLAGLTETVRRTPQGQRNALLNWAAYRGRELTGDLPETELVTELAEAGRAAGLEPREIAVTIASGLGIPRDRVRALIGGAS